MTPKEKLIAKAKKLGLELTGKEKAKDLKALIEGMTAPSSTEVAPPPVEPTDAPPGVMPNSPEPPDKPLEAEPEPDGKPVKKGPAKGVTVEYFHKGVGTIDQRTFLNPKDAKTFCENPNNTWTDPETGETKAPYEV